MTLARRQVIVSGCAAGLNAIKASGENGLKELSFSDPASGDFLNKCSKVRK
jgi:hypothetical protein